VKGESGGTMARRRGGAHTDTLRVAMLDAAGALLHEEGPQALTTRRLADAVGTSTQAIYTLFGGKEGIVRAMYLEGFDRLDQCLAEVDATAAAPDYLLGLGRAYRTAALRSPHYYDVMFGRPVPEFEPRPDDVERSLATQHLLTNGVARCIECGMLRAGSDADEVSAFLWAVAHGLVSLELTGHLDLGSTTGESRVYDGYLMASVAAWLAPVAQ
jgi:AcrR family transcriptional regulator